MVKYQFLKWNYLLKIKNECAKANFLWLLIIRTKGSSQYIWVPQICNLIHLSIVNNANYVSVIITFLHTLFYNFASWEL